MSFFFGFLFLAFTKEADDLYKFGDLAYGEAAAQIFNQIMRNESLSSTYSVNGQDPAAQAQVQFLFSKSEV